MNLREIAELADLETFGDVSNVPSAREIVGHGESETAPRRSRVGRYAAAVAGIAALFALVFFGPTIWRPGASRSSTLTVDELVTGAGESNTVILSDGTIVRMGPASRLRIGGTGPDREVMLNGRAYFVVASDPDHTFRVITPGGAVSALGTRFQVDAEASEVQVVVVEGRVAVQGVGDHIELTSGQMVHRRGGVLQPVEPAPSLSELSQGWMGRFLAFKNAPLSEVIEDLESMYDVEVVLTEGMTTEPTLTMWLADSSLENTLTIICNVIGADCDVEGGTVTIDPR